MARWPREIAPPFCRRHDGGRRGARERVKLELVAAHVQLCATTSESGAIAAPHSMSQRHAHCSSVRVTVVG